MKILVTGASGNVGKYVVKSLLQMGLPTVAAGTNIKRLKTEFGGKVDFVMLDFQDQHTFSEALKGINRVFLMRPPHLGKPEDLYPFIDAMKKENIQMVCFLSLMGVESNPLPPHHKIEKYIEHVGLPFAHLRPGFFMQNLSGIHSKEIQEKNEIFVPAGNSRTSFIDAEDIGLSAATLLQQYNQYQNTTHTITGSESLSYYEIAEILSQVSGRTIKYVKPSILKYRNHYIQQRNIPKAYVHVTVALYLMTRLGTAKHITDDFFRLTNQQPRTFREFAQSNQDIFERVNT
ncbi:SDR family oxidoreductase [Anoxynatronum sibiricum]|uniref:SDR family oxidoreductase n=1 Tax=Anoxynatronum sibiricum TaxID=210623 RepID=A0ABU9VXU7_9CLOT